jgi:molybdopterin synthase sulfur carrier subunit
MSEITVLAFGAVTDIVGKSSFVMSDVSSTAELKTKLETDFPALKNINYAIAVNKQMVTTETALDDRATVALLPPFSGG